MSDYENGVVEEDVASDVVSDDQQYGDSPAFEDGNDYVEPNDDSGVQESKYASNEDFKALREQNEELRRNIELMKYSQQSFQNQQVQQKEPDYDPDDLPTYKDVDKIVQERMGKVEASSRQQVLTMQVERASSTLPGYEAAIKLADQIIGSNKQMADMIYSMENPAVAAYNLAKTHPDFLKVTQSPAKADVVGKVKNNLSKPNTLNQASGGNPKTEIDYASMPKDDFEKEIRRVKALGNK